MIIKAILKGVATLRADQFLVGLVQSNKFSSFLSTQLLRNGISCHFQCQTHTSKSKSLSSKPIQQTDVPQSLRKGQSNTSFTSVHDSKEEKNISRVLEQKVLNHPKNGLLVSDLIHVSHEVYRARNTLLQGVTKLLNVISVHKCRFCPEVYIGHEGHKLKTCKGPGSGSRNSLHEWTKGTMEHVLARIDCFHLYDRLGNPVVSFHQRLEINRIPAIVELCIQAGLDIEDSATKNLVCLGNAIADKTSYIETSALRDEGVSILSQYSHTKELALEDDIPLSNAEEIREMGERTLDAWERMKVGAGELMKKYPVKACRCCPEVQVGPKGHKVGMCKGSEHQFRQGQHAWKRAILDDLIPPIYVLHVPDPNGPPLKNRLKKYYGKAPALVELCVQAGAAVPKEYKSMMRINICCA